MAGRFKIITFLIKKKNNKNNIYKSKEYNT